MRLIQTIHKRVLAIVLIALAVFISVVAMANAPTSASDSCNPSGNTTGTDTLTVTVPSSNTYTIWTRMQIPDSSDNSILLEVDNTDCYNVGGNSSMATNTWEWVNYYDGNAANTISLPLTAGSHTFEFIGTAGGVEVDRVLLLSDATCTPTGTGNNCDQTTTSDPTVSVTTGPSNGALVRGSISLNATATAGTGDTISQAQLLMNGAAVQTVTSAPYNFSLNTLTYKDGTYTLTVQATDNQSLVGSTSESITVTNGDLNGEDTVGLSDLAIMAAHWGLTDSNYADGNITGQSTINISDLAVLASNWGQTW